MLKLNSQFEIKSCLVTSKNIKINEHRSMTALVAAIMILFGLVGREMVYGGIGFCHESQISVLRFMRKSLNFL